MSEYWKSTPKYWCKHCSTYVKDTPFERKEHENTGKHQGNLKRFLRGIQNDHERAERDKEKAKAEVDRLNRVVGGQGSSSTTPTVSKPSSIRKSNLGASTAADQKRQWQQLAEMGIEVPDNFRGEMAMPGQWQTVSKPNETPFTAESSLSTGVKKRKILEQEEEEENAGEPVQRRGWGTTTRRYPGEDDPDLDALLSESLLKKDSGSKKVTQPPEKLSASLKPAIDAVSEGTNEQSEQTKAETEIEAVPDSASSTVQQTNIKREDAEVERLAASSEEYLEAASAPVFKKRKTKSKAGKEAD